MIFRFCLSGNANVVFLGLGFMFIFTAFTTVTLVQQTLIDTIKKERSFNADGFISLGLTYFTMLIFCWIAPSVVHRFGTVRSMTVSSLFFLVYVAVFIKLSPISLYIMAALLGIGASVLWTAQGAYITSISTNETTCRNIGYFWSLFQGSFFIGNLTLFLLLRKADFKDIYKTLFTSLTFICGTGICLLSLLFLPWFGFGSAKTETFGSLAQIGQTFRLFLSRNIILISFASFFNGINFSFITGIYPTCVTRTLFFGEFGKTLISLMAISIGMGEITGGILSSIRFLMNKYGRISVFFIGYVLNIICYYTIYNTLPVETTSQSSSGTSFVLLYFPHYGYIVLIGVGFLLGLSDGLVSTQIMGLITEHYYEASSGAYAIFKFVQSSGSALAFFTAAYFHLDHLMLAYFVLHNVALFAYYHAELDLINKPSTRCEESLLDYS